MGKQCGEYEALQMQRAKEREIRAIKRELAGYQGVMLGTDDENLLNEAQNKFTLSSKNLKDKEKELQDFVEQTGLKRNNERERVVGFNKSVSQKAVKASQNYNNDVTNINNSAIIKSTSTSEWKDFKTMSEAKEYVYTHYKDSDIDKITNVENINETFKTLNELQQKYPLKQEIFVRNKQLTNAGASASYEGININTSYFNNSNLSEEIGTEFKDDKIEFINKVDEFIAQGGTRGKLTAETKKSYNMYKEQIKYENLTVSKLYDETQQIKATVTHEYGHVLADQYFGQLNKFKANNNFNYFAGNECWEKCKIVSNVYDQALKNGDCLKISWYSSTNAHEFLAEVFSYREMGNILPDYINKMLKEVLKDGK